jgi:hypothetical protein
VKTFYVRPRCDAGYGRGDGTSYEDAWNGFDAVDWQAMAAGEPATLWVCGSPEGPAGFLTVHLEWSYLKQPAEKAIEPAGPHPRREFTESV